jgi:hypothetical protein
MRLTYLHNVDGGGHFEDGGSKTGSGRGNAYFRRTRDFSTVGEIVSPNRVIIRRHFPIWLTQRAKDDISGLGAAIFSKKLIF